MYKQLWKCLVFKMSPIGKYINRLLTIYRPSE